MNDMTLGIIYAVKRGMKSPRENVIDFMSKYTDSRSEVYTDSKLKDILIHAYLDYIDTADSPRFEMWQFFDAKRRHENYQEVYPENAAEMKAKFHVLDDDCEAIMTVFQLAAVCRDDKYINGFRDMKEGHDG